MDDQHDQPIDDTPPLNRSPSGVYRRSQSSPQFNAVGRNLADSSSYRNAHGLPVLSSDRMPPNQPFDRNLHGDYLLYSNADLHSRLEIQCSELSTALEPSSMQHSDEQAPLQPYDQSHGLPSAPDLPTNRARNSQRESALNHSILSYSADALDEEPNAQRQDPEITEGGHISHRDLPAQPTGAPISRLPTILNPPANEGDGLRFNSYADASSITDSLFRMPLKNALDDDDVDDVERDKRIHVSSIVDALKGNDVFLPPPESKKRGTVATTPAQKANWQQWQESAQQVVEINLSQPHSKELVELRAWKIIEEMIKIHRTGHRLTDQTIDQEPTCSERIAKALQIIKDYAIVRKKLLDNDHIPDFCVGPKQYASTTVVSFWSNCNKAAIAARNATAPRNPAPQRIPVATGSVALRYQPRSALPTKRSKAATKSAGEGRANVEGSSVEQECQSAVPRSGNHDATTFTGEHEGEETVEGSEADADFEWDEDANDGNTLSGRQQSSQHQVFTRTEEETLDDNSYAFGQDNLRHENRPLDEGNSSQGRYRHIRPVVSSAYPPTAANTYGSGPPTPFGPEGNHQFAATASDLAFPANDTFGGGIPGAGYLQHGVSTLGHPGYETQLPSGVLSNTVDQPTLGFSNAGLSEPDLQHELIYGSRTNKKRRLG
jgi:hypothetical protein